MFECGEGVGLVQDRAVRAIKIVAERSVMLGGEELVVARFEPVGRVTFELGIVLPGVRL